MVLHYPKLSYSPIETRGSSPFGAPRYSSEPYQSVFFVKPLVKGVIEPHSLAMTGTRHNQIVKLNVNKPAFKSVQQLSGTSCKVMVFFLSHTCQDTTPYKFGEYIRGKEKITRGLDALFTGRVKMQTGTVQSCTEELQELTGKHLWYETAPDHWTHIRSSLILMAHINGRCRTCLMEHYVLFNSSAADKLRASSLPEGGEKGQRSLRLRLLHINVQCLRNKIEQIEALCLDHDIVLFSEHWMCVRELEQVKLHDFTVLSSYSRRHRGHGGVAAALRNFHIDKFVPRNDINLKSVEVESEVCAIQSTQLKTLIIAVYRSPLGNFNVFLDVIASILELINCCDFHVFVLGDFNINFLRDSTNKSAIVDLFSSYGLHGIVSSATRGSACLDNIFTNVDDCRGCVIDLGFSDHLGIETEFVCDVGTRGVGEVTVCRPLTRVGMDTLKYLVRDICWDFIWDTNIGTESKFDMFVTFIKNCVDLSFPPKTYKHSVNSLPISWFSNDLKNMRERLIFYRDLVEVYKTPNAKKIVSDYQKLYRREIKIAKKQYNDNYIRKHNYNPRSVWNVIKSSTNLLKKKITSKNNITANRFNQFFVDSPKEIIMNIPPSRRTSAEFMNNYGSSIGSRLHDIRFKFSLVSEASVRDIIMKLNNKSSRDYYGFNIKILKSLVNELIGPLTKLMNLCLKDNIFPKILKVARVVPVHKKGSVQLVNNYRPISIIPLFSKVLERVMQLQLTSYFESNCLFNSSQFGFRSGLSTTAAITELMKIINEGYSDGLYVGGLFCDLGKAFDCVSREHLLYKLKRYQFDQGAIELLGSYLSDRVQCVDVGGDLSDLSSVDCGVPQGSVLGPLLFLIYVNDLVSCDPDADFVLFADDTTVLKKAQSRELIVHILGELSSVVSEWFNSNQLSLNETKTEYMYFSMRDLGGMNSLEPIKFLGVHMEGNLSWNAHIDKVCSSITSGVFALRSLTDVVSDSVLLSVYRGFIESRITYGILCWGHDAGVKRLFGLQRKAIRVLG
ncbi:uncharacterized protein LOC123684919 [Harmonia axyridis]|uniref:uncharacterized protein LOC123684919 n=1 Tax=Harmonia axyridis TaxID=115357 RepID=UPI001E2751DB|nr:uncharacterized protein LOC123684919 [Harmonia axyridis]